MSILKAKSSLRTKIGFLRENKQAKQVLSLSVPEFDKNQIPRDRKMITRLRLGNFRCFDDLSLPLGRFQLLLGSNGCGKSSLFDLLEKLRAAVLAGVPIHEIFKSTDCTRWDNGRELSFELELTEGEDRFHYGLVVEHHPQTYPCRIREEKLLWRGGEIYHLSGTQVKLHPVEGNRTGPEMRLPFDSSRSFLPMVPESPEFAPIHHFRRAIGRWFILRLSPAMMNPYSKEEQSFLTRGGENFSSWYRYVVQSHFDVIQRLKETLSEILPGFDQLSLEEAGEEKCLVAEFSAPSRHKLRFDELSDGQRVIIVLYAVIHLAAKLKCDLFLDEPDNFVMPREIQPLLVALEDLTDEYELQTILISHHPELLNLRGKSDGIRLVQRGNNPVKAIGLSDQDENSLPLAELMARGWEDD